MFNRVSSSVQGRLEKGFGTDLVSPHDLVSTKAAGYYDPVGMRESGTLLKWQFTPRSMPWATIQ